MERKEFENRYIKARREAIALDFKHLNDTQQDAVMATRGPLLLLAGAGSGKTTVLINRIANILKYGSGADSETVPEWTEDDDLLFLESYVREPDREAQARVRELCSVEPAEPWRIIAITFTNKAAGELKDRLERMLGAGAEDVWAMTFHSACVRILRRDIDKLGYERSFTIYDTSDSASVMKRILKELEINDKQFPYRTVLGYISRAKDAMLSPEAFMAEAEKSHDMRRRTIGKAYLEYTNRLKASNALDFDDLILMTVKLLTQHPDVLEYYQKRFKYVLIDEYQDTNNLQYLLAAALAGGHGNICVVGDDDQSIYKFRGATIENILSFEKRYKNARVIRLEQNYRSNANILEAANDVICNNKGRKGKKLWTENEPGDKPALRITNDERDEARLVADTIIANAAAGSKWSDHAVLYRMNAQSNQLETAFKRVGIPYRIIGGTGFYERAEIKDMLAYMCVVNNTADDLRLLRIINTPARGIGQATVGRLSELAAAENRPVFDVINESGKYKELEGSAGRLHKFADMVNDLRELANTVPLDAFYDELLEKSGYMRMLGEKDTDENIARIENVNELKTNIISFMHESGGTLDDFLSETALYTDLDRYDRGADCVVMMTMHSAKGLEFNTVFIVGAEEGIFPGARVIGEPEEMEEERRLCYVAMTRAKKRLIFTSARRRMLFGKTAANQPSRFVGEIKSEHLDAPDERSFGFDIDFDRDFGFDNDSNLSGSEPRRSAYSKPGGIRPSGGDYSARRKIPVSFTPPAASEPLPDYNTGDAVVHKAFGRGIITSMTPAGGDALLEVSFDGAGTKRLMLKSAAKFMNKESND